MTVSAQPLAFDYAANGVTTTFPYQCRILFEEQLKVYVDGVIQVGGYSVTNVGNQNGGDVVFSVAPPNGSVVLIRRISDRVRTADFQQAPYFTQEELLDLDQDYQTMLVQEAAAEGDKSIRIPSEETVNTILPSASERAGKQITFGANGEVQLTNTAAAIAGADLVFAATKAAADTLAAGLGDGATVIVDRDETRNFERTRYTVAAGLPTSPVDDTSFVQAGAGAVPRTTQSKGRDTASFGDFDVVSDGVTAESTKVQNALFTEKIVTTMPGTTVINSVRIEKPVTLIGAGKFESTIVNQNMINIAPPDGDLNDPSLVSGIKIIGQTFGQMATATADDFAAIHNASGDGAVIAFSDFESGVENGINTQVIDGFFGQRGFGAKDTLILGTRHRLNRRWTVQNLQGMYTRIIGLVSHSDGDNSANNGHDDAPPVNNGGRNGGVRFGGISKGNMLIASNIRDKRSSVSIQRGSNNNIISGLYSEGTYRNAVGIETTGPLGQGFVLGDTILADSGNTGVLLRNMSHCRVNALIDRTGTEAGGSAGYGIDAISSLATSDEVYRLEYTGGSGTVPAAGTTISQGAATGLLHSVEDDNINIIAAGQPMPATGVVLVRTVTGDFFKEGALTAGATATVNRAYSCDGRHRIDATIRHASAEAIRLGSNGNIVDLITEAGQSFSLTVSGSHNIIRLVVTDSTQTIHVTVTGTKNILIITDNSITAGRTAVLVSGNFNKVIGNVNGAVAVTGNDNDIDVIASLAINNTGSRNSFSGRAASLTKGVGTGNRYDKMHGGRNYGTTTATTNSAGIVNLSHGLFTSASSVKLSIQGSTLYNYTVVNPALNLTTAQLKFYDAAGVALNSVSVTFEWEAIV